MRVKNDAIHFAPQLPTAWDSFSFKVNFRGSVLQLTVSKTSSKVTLIDGNEVNVFVNGEKVSFFQEHTILNN